MTAFTHRLAVESDLERLHALMRRSIDHLQQGFLTPAQIKASHQVMGLDSQLIADRTYFIVLDGNAFAGCGGWSFRATLYGGDASVVARAPAPLNPATDAARIRAMYTDPDYARRGVGRMIMALCEDAARAAGFYRAQLMATLAGVPLYQACGYQPLEHVLSKDIDGERVPLVLMEKSLLFGGNLTLA